MENDLNELRLELLNDPYFHKVPSFDPKHKKTALCFHAKDDLPEIKWEVFKFLRQYNLKFFAEIHNKFSVEKDVQHRNEVQLNYRYHPNKLYDSLVQRLFKLRLHKDDHYKIVFSKRGNSDRTESLNKAIEHARKRLYKTHKIKSISTVEISASDPVKSPYLQAVDYYLWALQRLYERHDERYIKSIWNHCRIIHDIDDRRVKDSGTYYNTDNPISLEKLNKSE